MSCSTWINMRLDSGGRDITSTIHPYFRKLSLLGLRLVPPSGSGSGAPSTCRTTSSDVENGKPPIRPVFKNSVREIFINPNYYACKRPGRKVWYSANAYIVKLIDTQRPAYGLAVGRVKYSS